MAIAKRRTYSRRYNSYSRMRSVAKRVEDRALKRTMGMWFDVSQNPAINVTVGNTAKGGQFPLISRTTQQQAWEVYGMDLLFTLSLQANASAPVIGAIQICHVRSGQVAADFATGSYYELPAAIERVSLARPRSFLPFSLVGNFEDNPRASAVFPYRFFRGHKITILPAEQLVVMVCLGGSTPNNTKVRLDAVGRFRFIEKVKYN